MDARQIEREAKARGEYTLLNVRDKLVLDMHNGRRLTDKLMRIASNNRFEPDLAEEILAILLADWQGKLDGSKRIKLNNFEGFVVISYLNRLRLHARKKKRRTTHYLHATSAQIRYYQSKIPAPQQIAFDNERIEALRTSLYKLTPDLYDIIHSVYLKGRTLNETSQHLQIRLGTVKSRLHRGLNRLSALVDAHLLETYAQNRMNSPYPG